VVTDVVTGTGTVGFGTDVFGTVVVAFGNVVVLDVVVV
jgi:hypothetical protein